MTKDEFEALTPSQRDQHGWKVYNELMKAVLDASEEDINKVQAECVSQMNALDYGCIHSLYDGVGLVRALLLRTPHIYREATEYAAQTLEKELAQLSPKA